MTEKSETKEKKTGNKKSEVIEEVKLTKGFLKSKANYTISVMINNRQTFIPPFGKVKAIKEQIKFDSNDAKNLTFVKD